MKIGDIATYVISGSAGTSWSITSWGKIIKIEKDLVYLEKNGKITKVNVSEIAYTVSSE